MPSYCANLASEVTRFTNAQRKFFFAWKEVGASATHERRARLHTASAAQRELASAHELTSRTIHAMWNPREIVSIEKKHYGIEARQVIEMDTSIRGSFTTTTMRVVLMSNGAIVCGNRNGKIHMYQRSPHRKGVYKRVARWHAHDNIIGDDPITAIATRSDGMCLTGHHSGDVNLWDPARERVFWKEHNRTRILAIASNPQGQLIVSDRQGYSVYQQSALGYDALSDSEDYSLRDIQYMHAGQTLVAMGGLRLTTALLRQAWDGTYHLQEKIFPTKSFMAMHALYDGSIVAGHDDGTVRRLQKGESGAWEEQTLLSGYGSVFDVQVLPDDRLLLATQRSVYLFEKNADDRYALQYELPLKGIPTFARARSDGTIVAADDHGLIYIFDGEPV